MKRLAYIVFILSIATSLLHAQILQQGVSNFHLQGIRFIAAASSGSGLANPAVTGALNVKIGDKLVVFCSGNGTVDTFTITDLAGNTWTNGTHQNDTQIGNSDISSSPATIANAADTFKCQSNIAPFNSAIALQFRGGATSGIIDVQNNSAGGLVTSWTTGMFTTTVANETIVECLESSTQPRAAGNIGGVAAIIPTNGDADPGVTYYPACEYHIVNSIQTGITASLTFPNGYYNGQMGSFK